MWPNNATAFRWTSPTFAIPYRPTSARWQLAATCTRPTVRRVTVRRAALRTLTAPGGHTDGELFYWVSYGFPNSAMPAWKDLLTEEQRWSVLNYARAPFGNSVDTPPPATGDL